MPELPDIVVYQEALERHTRGDPLEAAHLPSPFVLRSVEAAGREAGRVGGVEDDEDNAPLLEGVVCAAFIRHRRR